MENYQITRDQIRKLTDPQAKEWFPEAFENELEFELWYKVVNVNAVYLLLFSGNEYSPGFYNEKWSDAWAFRKESNQHKATEATEEEVFEALKNEAVKRGFVEGAFYKNTIGKDNLKVSDLYFGCNGLHSSDGDGMIFLKGKWATIIETITKEEAEKLLNKKIID